MNMKRILWLFSIPNTLMIISFSTILMILTISLNAHSKELNLKDRIKAIDLKSLSLGGNIRIRFESTDIRNYRSKSSQVRDDFSMLRTRLWFQADPARKVRAYIQLQDSRVFGSEGDPSLDSQNVDLHQAFIEVRKLFSWPLDVKIGRMELSYGDQRLISPLDWSNVGRAWDGAVLRIGGKKLWADIFGTTLWERGAHERDREFGGLYYFIRVIPRHDIDIYYLYKYHGDFSQISEDGTKFGNMNQRIVGTRASGNMGSMEYTAEVIHQFGFRAGDTIRAWASAFTAAYDFKSRFKLRISAEYNFASGDTDSTDGVVETFESPFPFSHAYQGIADVVGWRNIEAVRGGFSFKPHEDWILKADVHNFQLVSLKDAWYSPSGSVVTRDSSGNSGRNIGSEVDLQVKTVLREVVELSFGYALFIKGEYITRTITGINRSWFFSQASVRF